MKLGDRLKELRNEKDITLKQLETKTGISLPYLSEIEREVSYPTVKVLNKIASFYKLTLAELMGGFPKKESFLKSLPKGLQELMSDNDFKNYFKGERGEEWVKTLQGVEFRGERAKTKEDWIKIFLILKDTLDKKQ